MIVFFFYYVDVFDYVSYFGCVIKKCEFVDFNQCYEWSGLKVLKGFV